MQKLLEKKNKKKQRQGKGGAAARGARRGARAAAGAAKAAISGSLALWNIGRAASRPNLVTLIGLAAESAPAPQSIPLPNGDPVILPALAAVPPPSGTSSTRTW